MNERRLHSVDGVIHEASAACPGCRALEHRASTPATTDERYSWLDRNRLSHDESEAIQRALFEAERRNGLRGVQVAAFVHETDPRFASWRSFVDADTLGGWVHPDRPDQANVLVGSGRLRHEIARTTLHEVRHVAQVQFAPVIWSSTQLREDDANAFAEDVLVDLVARDRRWWIP